MDDSKIIVYTSIPYNVFNTELQGVKSQQFQKEVNEIMGYYRIYDKGADFPTDGNENYIPSDTRFKKARDLINKEARFLFSEPPDFTVNPDRNGISEQQKEQNTILNDFLNKVLTKTGFKQNLVKSAKDCFIGKRVACMLNFDEEGISATMLNSTEFLYEYKGKKLVKLVGIFVIEDSDNRDEQVIKKKKYEMGDDDYCYVEETLYKGTGEELPEGKIERTRTEFTHIPGVVITNEGLLNDAKGVSDIQCLEDYESLYSKLANTDIDAENKNMNPIRYTLDASPESTNNLSVGPGAYWDLQTDQTGSDPKTAKVGMLESQMSYSGPLKVTLDRIENTMFSELEIPNVNSEKLQGVITSGKTLKALYWSLIVRCNEKMLVWKPALESISMYIIEGAMLYPESAKIYTEESLPNTEYEVLVENNYPLPEDTQEEKTMDLAEVAALVMSKKSYMRKWRGLTDEECDAELKQIALERQLLEDSMIVPNEGGTVKTTEQEL